MEMASNSSWMNFTTNFTGSTTSSVAPPPSLPQWFLWLEYVVFYLMMAGISGTFMNTVITVCVLKNKQFRSRFYIIVGYLSFTRTLTSIEYIGLSVYKMWMLVNPTVVYQYRIVCDLINLIVFYSITDVVLLIFMVIDRMVAILQPTRYRLLTSKQATISGGVILIGSFFVHVFPVFFGVELMGVVACANGQSGASVDFSVFCNYEPFLLTILLLVLQLVAVGTTWQRLKGARQNGQETENSVFLKRQGELMKTLVNMVLSHSVLTLLCRICLLLFGVLASLAIYFVAAVAILQTVDIFISPIVLLCSKKDLRQACFPNCGAKRTEDSSLNVVVKSATSLPEQNDADKPVAEFRARHR